MAAGRGVADQLRPKVPKPATLMDDGEADVLADMALPLQHRIKPVGDDPLAALPLAAV